MQGMTGRKRVFRFSGKWHAAPVTGDGAAVRSLLIDEGFKHMRQDGRRQRGRQHLRTQPANWLLCLACEEPSYGCCCDEQVLVGAPRQSFGTSLDARVGMARNRTSDLFIKLRGTNSDRSHKYDPRL